MALASFYNSGSARVVYPVHKGSTASDVKFFPLSKRQAAKIYHDARRFERRTRKPGNQDGAIGRNGLAILQAMLFDCINYVSGELFPTYETLARLANISRASVGRGLAKLKSAGVVKWLMRCHRNDDGTMEQDSNAYSVQKPEAWRGYFTPAPAPIAPQRGTWGDPASCDPLDVAAAAIAAGDRKGAQLALESETDASSAAAALAKLGRAREKNRDSGARS